MSGRQSKAQKSRSRADSGAQDGVANVGKTGVNDAADSVNSKQERTTTTETSDKAEAQFRDWYVQQLTKCFGEEIDGLRKGSDTFLGTSEDLSSLIVALKTGQSIAVFEQAAKGVVVHSLKAEKRSKKKIKPSNE